MKKNLYLSVILCLDLFLGFWLFSLHPSCALADQENESPIKEQPATPSEQPPESQSQEILEQERKAAREVARLTEMLKLPSRQRDMTNWDIVQALIKLGKPAVPALITEMEKADPFSMAAAMYCLGIIGDRRVLPHLYRLLPRLEEEEEEAGTNLKSSICFSLGLLGDPNCIPLVMQGPHAASRTVAGGSINYIGACATFLGDQAVDPLIEVVQRYKDEKKIYGAVSALGKVASARAIPFLKSLLEHPDDKVKSLAIGALAQIGDPSTSEFITPFLDNSADLLRESSAEAMYYLRDRKAIKKLCKLAVEDPVVMVRVKSLMSLGVYGEREAFETLLIGASDQDVSARIIAIECIGKSGNKAGSETLRKKIKDMDTRVGMAAVNAYEKLMERDAETHLIKVLNDTRWIIQREAIRALARMHSIKSNPAILSILKGAVADGEANPEYRNIVFETLLALSELGNEKTIEALKELSSKILDTELKNYFSGTIHDLSLKIANGKDVKKWIETLQNGNLADQTVAIEMLARLGDRSATAALIEAFGRMDIDAASAIPKALGKLKDQSAVPFLEDLLTNDVYDEKDVYPARENAAWVLGELGSKSSVKALKDCLRRYDGEPFSAIMAIVKLLGKDAIDDLREIKTRIMRAPSRERMKQYDNVNWLIRNLKNGWDVEALDEEPSGHKHG
ncbi:MAG: HEAT repeat domain-containing protein [Acidobacteriota bacterium]